MNGRRTLGCMKFDPTRYVWEQVAEAIAADIASGRLPQGARLPGVPDLAGQYGVAPGTARRAVRELRERGLVVTLPNKGTFVVITPDSNGVDGR
jgi:GntR family transcriptional regulator